MSCLPEAKQIVRGEEDHDQVILTSSFFTLTQVEMVGEFEATGWWLFDM